MIVKTITFEDFNGNTRTEEHCFHLSKAEITKMQMGVVGGLDAMITRIVAAQDAPAVMSVFEELIEKSYGVRTPDGRGFDKDPKHFKSFKDTEAYSQLFMELLEDADKASEFFIGMLPKDLQVEAAKALPAMQK